ncbi:hybrid sensor histidine kinase/response regulator transcription factor [uncultured Polaribacter sp.]|uniref:hybrid sensor histidine kinase/response regulator transcription factor n=1 Tax=uncultured Polaribacter sp. TaxID=174711 RepID=UPI002615ED88|nr:hybrid sensor histidine kinase/response regulator transcription factor [uncultured Polaribacter sp.]
MKFLIKQKLILVFLSCCVNILSAQISDFNFRNINISNGLSNNTVASIQQDKFGQMWFATSNGLNKFNGKEFTVYRNIPNNKNSISSSEIISVLVDREGFVWAGTFNGLNRFDPKTNTFKRYYKITSDKHTLTNGLVICSAEMRGGNIWFGTANGISIFEKNKNRFIRFLQGNAKTGFNYINDISLDKKDNVWLATNKGIIKVEKNKNNKFKTKRYLFTDAKNNFIVNDLLEIKPGIIGVATKYDGFLIFDAETEKFSRPKQIEVPTNIDVRDQEVDNDGNLWITTTTGLYIVTPNKKTTLIQEGNIRSFGNIQNEVRTIYKDRNGLIWLGTQNGGVMTWDKSYQNFLHFKNKNLINNITNSIVSDNKNNIYFATEGGVVNLLNKSGEITEIFRIQNQEKTIQYPIQSLYIHNSDLLFIGTSNKGVIVYDVKLKKKRTDIISQELSNYIDNVIVFDIKEDTEGNLYIGTFGKGLIKYNLKNKNLKVYTRPQLATNIIKSIHIDEKGNLLVAGIGGLTKLEFDKDKELTFKNYFKKTFVTFNVSSVYKDKNNNIWAGTTTRGLYKYIGNDFKKVTISKKNKISTVNSILEGEKGVLWMSTDKGIVKYNSQTKKSTIYNQRNNIPNIDFRQNSAIKVGTQFYFGDLQGVTTFNSEKITKTKEVPKVVLSNLKIKNEAVTIDGEDRILSKSLNYTEKVELRHNNSNFSVSYALPNYINSNDNQYAYRLRGLDNSWTYTKQNEAFFTLQTAGTYVFQVKGANHDGIWSKRVTRLIIIIHPAPWKTWWAYTIYFIVVFGMFYGIAWILQSKSRLKNKLELEYIANKKNEDLNKAKLEFFTNISHEFRTPLTLIIGPLQNILSNYTGSNEIYKKLKIIESSTNHLLRLINRLMDFRKLESNQFQLEAAEGNIVKFLKEIFLSFSEHAKDGNYIYEFITSEEEILVYYDRYKLERVFFNLISNAFRYTKKGGEIYLKIKQIEKKIVITVEDSGVGIAEEFVDKIFDRFFEVAIHKETEGNYVKGTGIGLSIAKNIVKLHHGEITVENLKPKGAKFSVVLKLGRNHLKDKEILKNYKKSDDVSQYAIQMNMPTQEKKEEVKDLLIEEKEYTILIVEDNTVLRSFIKEVLKPKYNVLQAENGKIALKKAIKYLPDLIISDVVMPEMVGTELCSKIKTTLATSHIPVILLTSRTSLIYKFEGLESGADDYITKPFNLKEFDLKIKNILNSKQHLKNKFSSETNFKSLDISLTSLDQKLLEKAFKIVKENISNPDFNIAQFSEDLGVSRSMLFTKIKAWANATPNEFIQEIRLNHAAKLLELDKFSVSEVGYKVGFKRPKYFSQCFKKKYGTTPSEFSKKFTNKD